MLLKLQGWLFRGFGQTQVRKFFPLSEVTRVLKMQLFQLKIFERACARDVTWWEELVLYLIYLKTPLGTHAVKNAMQFQEKPAL